jgi:predicted acetyltransferase
VSVAVEVEAVLVADKDVLRRLIEFYSYDFSEYTSSDVGAHGTFGYRHLDCYWTEPDRHPFFIRVDGRLAGFALVRSGEPHDMAEFFVMRRYRRSGVGMAAAREVFQRFPGSWEVRQMEANAVALAFWRSAIPVPFDEGVCQCGSIQRFTIEA